MSRRNWQILVAAIIGVAILSGLGIWQVQRLGVKQALIRQMEERRAQAPISLDEAVNLAETTGDVDYLPIAVRGRFAADKEILMLTTFDGNAGWRVITPFVSDKGIVVLVDRGVIPDNLRDARDSRILAGDQAIEGYALWHRAGQRLFDPENAVDQNKWFWWDVPAMLASVSIGEGLKTAPFILHLNAKADDRSFPRPVAVAETLHNNHLQYAITWFALALVLAVLAGLAIRSDRKQAGRTGR
ncbi:MAG: SURF1 family protein [Rhizobiales bacterium]|nr:SURF1 family protein [Hyphomicrobiales bacterium]